VVRMGSGFDVHPFRADDTTESHGQAGLRLAGVEIASGPPLDGHSDADVAVHAVCDALLGALAMGDLGSRFGTDNPETAGADSVQLLRTVVDDVATAGWRLGNLDVTIIAQQPRLSGYRDAMRQALAEACNASLDDVSVKFTTTDSLGFVGRGEGIAAWATCVVTALHR
ncbi:MAG: 2-C-methyl-D-erythritol 2,4-cyclodiphosphate synthase, partial [Nitriliruptoraceae bacterium]